MTTTVLAPYLTQQCFTNAGAFLSGGLLYTYAGGSNTPLATYVDSTGTTTNTNPIVLNARGECSIWIPPNVSYKFVLQDSAGNVIWTRDNVIQQILTTLYGGVDTGSVNAIVLNFTAPYSALANGILIYFIAANTNTGACTLNVNSLGTVPVVTQSGLILTAGAITANTVTSVLYYNGNWLLVSSSQSVPMTGTFTATIVGGSNPNLSCTYSVSGITVNVNIPYCAFTSTLNQFYLSGLPSTLSPASNKLLPVSVMQNNGAYVETASAALQAGSLVITFLLNASATGWTASGTKGIGIVASGSLGNTGITLSYNLL